MSSEPAGPATTTATTATTASVSTHILDTSAGRPAAGVGVELSVRTGREAEWSAHAASVTDADGRCKDLPALPAGTVHARLTFGTEPYLQSRSHSQSESQNQSQNQSQSQSESRTRTDETGERGSFFPEVTVVFAVSPGEHYHVPLLLNPFGYSVYRGS